MSGGYCAHVWSMRRQRWYEVGTRGGAAAFVSLVVMLSAGCGSLDPNRATDERTSSSTSYAAWRPSRPVTGQTMSAQQLADYYRGEFIPALDTKDVPAPPPEVQPVRWVYFEEVGTEVAKCLREEGFDANPTVGGRGVSVQFGNASQQSAFAPRELHLRSVLPGRPKGVPISLVTRPKGGCLRVPHDLADSMPTGTRCRSCSGSVPRGPRVRSDDRLDLSRSRRSERNAGDADRMPLRSTGRSHHGRIGTP